MIAFPNCKINLGLNITAKRADGYHDIETVFYPLPLTDVLEIIRFSQTPATGYPENGVEFTVSGVPVAGEVNDNLCIKAYQLLRKKKLSVPPIKMHLHKSIPMGAGLGGGSSDAAYTLLLLNEKFQLGLSPGQLQELALQIGSDCPFFISNKSSYATGRGEQLEEFPIDLSSWTIVIAQPEIPISTAWAFSKIEPARPGNSLKASVRQPPEAWKDQLINQFESIVIEAHPVIGTIKQKLYEAGAVYCSMTGSGSCLYALFHPGKLPAAFDGWPCKIFIINPTT